MNGIAQFLTGATGNVKLSAQTLLLFDTGKNIARRAIVASGKYPFVADNNCAYFSVVLITA
jgi:hypothetical protein